MKREARKQGLSWEASRGDVQGFHWRTDKGAILHELTRTAEIEPSWGKATDGAMG
jgi:hypothetical protein